MGAMKLKVLKAKFENNESNIQNQDLLQWLPHNPGTKNRVSRFLYAEDCIQSKSTTIIPYFVLNDIRFVSCCNLLGWVVWTV